MRLPADSGTPPDEVELTLDGKTVRGHRGEPLASALLAADQLVLGRSVKYHRPRAAFCMQGSCGACLVRIDGNPNLRACLTPVEAGMKVERQNAYPSATLDLFGATDFFFPRGMDHHTLFTGAPRPMHAVMQKIARQLAGLGRLPDERPLEVPPARTRRIEILVVGAGPAGLSAATAAAAAGRRVLLVDEGDAPGGSLLADPRGGPTRAAALVAAATTAGVELVRRATALAFYPEDRLDEKSAPGLVAVATHEGLLLVAAERYVYTTGSYDQNAIFPDNDRPGILSARAVGRLLVRDRILPGQRIVVLGGGPYARALAEALQAAGASVEIVDGAAEEIVAVDGHKRVRSIRVRPRGSQARPRRIACDLVAIAALPSPATELFREHHGQVSWEPARGGFCAVADRDGRTAQPTVFAAGDVTGMLGPDAAIEMGARLGAVLARPVA